MDADRAHSPTAGAAVGVPPRLSTPGQVGQGQVGQGQVGQGQVGQGQAGPTGGLDLLERSDGPWIPIDTPADRSRSDRPTVDHRDRRERRRDGRRAVRRLTVAYVAVLTLLIGGAVVAVTANHGLRTTNRQLAAVRVHLEQTIGRARVAERHLDTVAAESTAAATTLSTETAQLTAAQAQLASTEADVFTNGVSIGQLDTCLAGVERALNQISLNDQQGAAASLDGVATACRAAEPSP